MKEIYDLMYNQKDVCDAFRAKGPEAALDLIRQKAEELMAADGAAGGERETAEAFLTALNQSLFYYVLFTMNPGKEYTFCPWVCRRAVTDEARFMEEATEILFTYEHFIRPVGGQNQHIDEACRYIRAHLSEELTLEKVASQIYVGRCHLCWLFRTNLNMRFCEYVTAERVQRAKVLLQDEELSVDAVAEMCGFSSSSYFSTVFKKNVGMSPRAFRKYWAQGA